MRYSMRWICLTLALISLLPLAATAQRPNELSATVVGVEEVRVPAGALALLRAELEPLQTEASGWAQVVGDEVPAGSRVYVWDAIGKRYWVEEKTASGWEPDQSIAGRGEGFWLRGSAPASASEVVVRQVGRVPGLSAEGSSIRRGIPPGFSLLGYPYPAVIAWTNTWLWGGAPVGSVLLTWDVEGQVYRTYEKGRWGWAGSRNGTLDILEGFGIDAAGAWEWEEAAPYSWPGTVTGVLEVVSVRVREGAIQLELKARTWTDRVWEVYASESEAGDEGFPGVGGVWRVAETNLLLGSEKPTVWTDPEPWKGGGLLAVRGRYYAFGPAADTGGARLSLSDGRKTLIHERSSVASSPSAETVSSGEGGTANPETSAEEARLSGEESRTIYVNGQTGDDRLDGLMATARGSSGPKKTIYQGFGVARVGDVVTIAEGVYQVQTVLGAPGVTVQAGPNVVIGR